MVELRALLLVELHGVGETPSLHTTFVVIRRDPRTNKKRGWSISQSGTAKKSLLPSGSKYPQAPSIHKSSSLALRL